MLRISGTGESHLGLVRPVNEDAAFVGSVCALVADGVGGGAAGEVASATAAYALAAAVLAEPTQDPAQVLRAGFRRAQEAVRAGVAQDASRAGMATTLTAVVTDGTRFVLGHLGDSRAYVVRAGVLTRVSRDHTYVQDLLDDGRLTPAESAVHPWRNVVLRTVNGSPAASEDGTRDGDGEPDLVELFLEPGDRVLLASDGLTDLVAEEEIELTLRRRSDDDAVGSLVAAALGRGGRDNITCVVGTVIDGPPVSADGRVYGSLCDPANIVAVAERRTESA